MRCGSGTGLGRWVLALALLAATTAGCGGAGSGEALYASECATCHGPDRSGIDGLGPSLAAGSLALGETDDWLTRRIETGYGRMPPMGRILTGEQIGLVAGYLRTASGVAEPPGSGTADPALVATGKALFEIGKGCVACHGPDAAGTDVAPSIVGSSATRISGALGEVPAMANLEVTANEVAAISAYLRSLADAS